jgi:hypothetical protein
MVIEIPPIGRFHWTAADDAFDDEPIYARVVSHTTTPEHEAFLRSRYAGRRVVTTVGATGAVRPPAGGKLVLVWEFLEKTDIESLCGVFERAVTTGPTASSVGT